MRRFLTWFFPLATVAIVCMGCYTVLVHPGTEENYTSHDYQQNCTDCHSDYHEYPYGYFYGDYPDYWWDTPRYGHYYAYPWWWDYYWYTEKPRRQNISDNGGDEAPDVRGEGKKIERRQTLRPPYTDDIPTISREGYNTGSGTTTGPSGGSTGGNSGSTTGSANSKNQDKKTESKKTPRRDTGRKK